MTHRGFVKWICKVLQNRTSIYCLMKVCYDFIYLFYITKIYDYSGSIADINLWKNIMSWALLILFLALYSKIKECDLKLCMSLLMTLSIVPTLSVFWIGNKSLIAMAEISIYWIIFEFAMIYCSQKEYRLDKKEPALANCLSNSEVISFVWAITIILTIYFSYRYGNFRLMVRFEDVYDLRLDSGNYMNTLESYLFCWTSSLIIPFCLSVHAVNKKWIFVVIDVLLGLMSYAIYGNKSMFFQLLAVLDFWY